MKLLDEIREQPLHIRKIFMWTLVVITFSFIGYAWFDSTQKDFVALLNRDSVPAEQERALAQTTHEPASPFQNIKNSISNFGANISKL
ncbi:MAG TPA: hypothetical protein VJC11_02955, partial [Patescibacteria group bacterium]|nr:hypothetical protein [Patescibacteria group bacterium]